MYKTVDKQFTLKFLPCKTVCRPNTTHYINPKDTDMDKNELSKFKLNCFNTVLKFILLSGEVSEKIQPTESAEK